MVRKHLSASENTLTCENNLLRHVFNNFKHFFNQLFQNSSFNSFCLARAGWYMQEYKGLNDQVIIYGKIDFIFF